MLEEDALALLLDEDEGDDAAEGPELAAWLDDNVLAADDDAAVNDPLLDDDDDDASPAWERWQPATRASPQSAQTTQRKIHLDDRTLAPVGCF